MTVRDAEKLVKSILQPAPKVNRAEQTQSREVERLTQRLTDMLGAEVKLKHKKMVRVVLRYFSIAKIN